MSLVRNTFQSVKTAESRCLCCAWQNSEAEAVTKTYAVHAVVDVKQKKRLSFREAIDQNIFDPDAGSYLNTATNEKLYVGDAISKGLIKVRLVITSRVFCFAI